jgi:hypothetical protein
LIAFQPYLNKYKTLFKKIKLKSNQTLIKGTFDRDCHKYSKSMLFRSSLDGFGRVWMSLDEFGRAWMSLEEFG